MISVIASSDTVSSVKCASFIADSVTSSEDGIAIITTTALRHERRKKSITIPVKMIASIKVRTTPWSCSCVYVDWTLRTENSTSGYVRRRAGSAAMTRFEVSTSLVPADFCTSSSTHGMPSE